MVSRDINVTLHLFLHHPHLPIQEHAARWELLNLQVLVVLRRWSWKYWLFLEASTKMSQLLATALVSSSDLLVLPLILTRLDSLLQANSHPYSQLMCVDCFHAITASVITTCVQSVRHCVVLLVVLGNNLELCFVGVSCSRGN